VRKRWKSEKIDEDMIEMLQYSEPTEQEMPVENQNQEVAPDQ
jgi:hypothetical protein